MITYNESLFHKMVREQDASAQVLLTVDHRFTQMEDNGTPDPDSPDVIVNKIAAAAADIYEATLDNKKGNYALNVISALQFAESYAGA